jgi:NAD(P)-dependent dehydrogenase (short-subunit alcohol dehydrogenase family)
MKRDKGIEWRRVDVSSLDLKGWKVVVVGGTGGLGRAISRLLASRGASVTVVGQTFRDAGVAGIEFIKADLSLMREAERIGKALPAEKLDLVVFTTGIFAAPTREVTAEGIERDMAVSYLSRLVIVREIAPRLGKDRPATQMKPRVFIMGYPGRWTRRTEMRSSLPRKPWSLARMCTYPHDARWPCERPSPSREAPRPAVRDARGTVAAPHANDARH